MSKGHNAAKTFTATRAARFSEARRESEARKDAERKAGTRRTMVVVNVEDVRDDDEVAVTGGGFRTAGTVDRSEWATSNGQTFVLRFVTDGSK